MNQAEVRRKQIEAVCRVIGVAVLLIFGKKLQAEGTAYLAAALEIFDGAVALCAEAVPDVLGRMLRSRKSRSQHRNADCIRHSVLLFQVIAGAVVSILLALLADFLTEDFLPMPCSALSLRILALALFFRIVSSVFLGFFLGNGVQMPSAAVSLLRSMLWLIFGSLFAGAKGAYSLGAYGEKVSTLLQNDAFVYMYRGAGLCVGMVLTEALLLLFVLIVYLTGRRAWRDKESLKQTEYPPELLGGFFKALLVPVLEALLIGVVPLWIGLAVFQKSTETIYAGAAEYGTFYGSYVTLLAIPVLLCTASLFPVMARCVGAFRKEEYRAAGDLCGALLHIGFLYSLFAVIFLTTLGPQAAAAFTPGDPVLGGKMLQQGAVTCLFLIFTIIFSTFLRNTGYPLFALGGLAGGNLVFLFTALLFIKSAGLGVMGLVYAGLIGSLFSFIVTGFFLVKAVPIKWDLISFFAVPLGAGSLIGLLCLFLGKALSKSIGNGAAVLICLIISVVLYWGMLTVARNFREYEWNFLTGGRLWKALSKRLFG